jgi:hypothetical protein
VTQVCFNNGGTEIATGSEDGLVCIYDTRHVSHRNSAIFAHFCTHTHRRKGTLTQSKFLLFQAKAEDSLQCVINADCPVRKVGFFAPGGEGVYVLTVYIQAPAYH